MGVPTLFRSDDTGAPTLSGTEGSLIDVLKACLVDGYGAKAALGLPSGDAAQRDSESEQVGI